MVQGGGQQPVRGADVFPATLLTSDGHGRTPNQTIRFFFYFECQRVSSGSENCLRTVGAQSAYVSDSALCDGAAVQ